jgi:hypothetical protein
MERQEFWIAHAQLAPAPADRDLKAATVSDSERMHRDGHIRITVAPGLTEIKWSVFAPNWSSLYFAMEWLATTPGPYVLKYFLSGWFEEAFQSASDASDRIDQIIAKSDLHLMSRAYVRETDLERTRNTPPDLLRDTWNDQIADPATSVDCVFDERTDRFRVQRVGPKSTIARLWGSTSQPFPCVNGGSYDRIVSAAYMDVARTKRPRYDHVYAVMTTPDNQPVWIPYQRVILPSKSRSGPAVSVVTELAPVEIQII